MPPLLDLCHSLDPVAVARERLPPVMNFPFFLALFAPFARQGFSLCLN
jgi:hypothetical protein